MSVVMVTISHVIVADIFDSNFFATSNKGNYGSLLSLSSGGVKKASEDKGSENFKWLSKIFDNHFFFLIKANHLVKEVSHLLLSNKELL